MSDTKKLRKALDNAGFRRANSWLPKVFNDKRKCGIRRLKLWTGTPIFDAPHHAQIELQYQLNKQFGDRFLFGEFIRMPYWVGEGKSFVVYLTD